MSRKSTLFFFFFLGGGRGGSHQHISQRAVRTSLEKQLDPREPKGTYRHLKFYKRKGVLDPLSHPNGTVYDKWMSILIHTVRTFHMVGLLTSHNLLVPECPVLAVSVDGQHPIPSIEVKALHILCAIEGVRVVTQALFLFGTITNTYNRELFQLMQCFIYLKGFQTALRLLVGPLRQI